jgi:hypothetical protein
MAPRVASRLGLALRVARRRVGSIRRFFHPRHKPTKVPASPTFENITPGFEAVDARGRPLARFVDETSSSRVQARLFVR